MKKKKKKEQIKLQQGIPNMCTFAERSGWCGGARWDLAETCHEGKWWQRKRKNPFEPNFEGVNFFEKKD